MEKKLSAEEILMNWEEFIEVIKSNITGERKEKLLDFYNRHKNRIMIMPASHKKEYHSSYPGGYIVHVLGVVYAAIELHSVWRSRGGNVDTYTFEELIFSAINHDLGKMGDEMNEAYLPQTDEWRKNKLGEQYMYNTNLPFTSVPDRSLFLLQANGIPYTFNEMLAILTHDGLYDEANKKYLMGFLPEQKPRTNLIYILHQADIMAARIEFEKDWLKPLNKEIKKEETKNFKEKTIRQKALNNIKSPGLQSMLDNL
jgi:hypothetical protein